MKFEVKVESAEYLDGVPHLQYGYKSDDVVDFAEYVQSAIRRIKDMLNFDEKWRDTYEVRLTVFVDEVLQATEHFRRSEDKNDTKIISWRILHNL
jgi:hypothetical protein